MKSLESYRQLVILFWGPICIKNTFYVIACSMPFVLLLFWSVLFEKLDCKHLRGSHLLTFFWISEADLYVTSRWPDTSVFHSPIPALVPRPKFITALFPDYRWEFRMSPRCRWFLAARQSTSQRKQERLVYGFLHSLAGYSLRYVDSKIYVCYLETPCHRICTI